MTEPNPFLEVPALIGPEPQAPANPFMALPVASTIDRRTGAPVRVRELVGSAPVRDRLAQIRQLYPDAQPYEGSNFVFTNPETGRATLYNEDNPRILFGTVPVPTLGDVASLAREGTMLVGGTLAGMGAAAAAPFTGGAAGMAVPLAVGAGTAASGAAYDAIRGAREGTVDTRGIGQRLTDTAVDFGSGAVGQGLADSAGPLVRRMFAGTMNRTAGVPASQLAADFERVGAPPTAGQITGNRFFQGVEEAAGRMPTGAGRMAAVRNAQTDAMSGFADDLAARYGGGVAAGSNEQAGRALQHGVGNFIEQFQDRADRLYGTLGQLLPRDTPVAVPNVIGALRGQAARFSSTPALGARLENPTLRGWLNAVLDDAAGILAAQRGVTGNVQAEAAIRAALRQGVETATLPYEAVSAFRSSIGRRLADPVAVADIPRAELQQVYGALSEDMRAAATAAGPEALRVFDQANRFYAAGQSRIEQTLARVQQARLPEQALSRALDGSRQGATALTQLRRSVPAEDWDVVSSQVLQNLGRATPGAQNAAGDAFSPTTFLTNLNRLSPGAQEALFGGTRYAAMLPDLQVLSRVAGAFRDSRAMANPSGTAGTSVFMRLVSPTTWGAGVGVGTGAATGDLARGLATGLLLNAVDATGPYSAARLMTSPRFVNWLAQSTLIEPNPRSMYSHLTRLFTLADADPAVRNYLDVIGGQVGANAPTSADRQTPAPTATQ